MADRLISNKYELRRLIGHGGMGSVYEAYHRLLDNVRALKQLQRRFADDPVLVNRFRGEAKKLAKLRHPNIVIVHEIEEDNEFGTYLSMELIDGSDLREFLAQHGRLPYEQVLDIGVQLAGALDHAHRQARAIIHRDIKPANILIERTTHRAVLTDFGIAKELQQEGDTSAPITANYVGTYRYSSGEQLRNEKAVDGRTDVYSLGVVLYEMYSGLRFLDGYPDLKVANRVGFQEHWEPLEDLKYTDAPPEHFRRLIQDCVTRLREERIPSAVVLMQRLRECVEDARNRPVRLPASTSEDATVAATFAAKDAGLDTLSEAPTQPAAVPPADIDAQDDETRGTVRLRGRLDQERRDLQERLDILKNLVNQLALLGQTSVDLEWIREASDRLEEVEQARTRTDLEPALATTERLTERATAAQTRVEQTIRETLAAGMEALRGELRAFAMGADDLLEPRILVRILSVVDDDAAVALEQKQWSACRTQLDRAREMFQQARHEVQRRGEAAMQVLFARIADLEAELALVDETSGATVVPGWKKSIADRSSAGLFGQAKAQVAARVAELEALLLVKRQAVQEEAESVRARFQQARGRGEVTAAIRVAPALFEGAERVAAQARAHYGAREYRRATAAFEEAAGMLTAALVSHREAVERQQRYQRLRDALPTSIDRLATARATASEFNAELAAVPERGALEAQLSEADAIFAGGDSATALARLEDVERLVGQASDSVRQRLNSAMDAELEGLDARRTALERSAGQLLGVQPFEAYARERQRIVSAAGGNSWDVATKLLVQARAFLVETRARAENDAAQAAGQIRDEIDGLSAAAVHMSLDGTGSAIQPSTIHDEMAVALEAGEFDAALEQGRATAALLTREVAEIRARGRDAVGARREAIDALLRSFDAKDAQRTAPDLAADAQAAQRAAEDAVQTEHYGEAVRAYESARSVWQGVAQRLQAEREEERRQRTAEVNERVAHCTDGPPEIVAEALQIGRDALSRAPELPHAQAMRLLNDGKVRLQAAIDELPVFISARIGRENAMVSAQRVSRLRPAPRFRQLRAARAAMNQAEGAFARRRWSAAIDAFATAQAKWNELEQAIEQHRSENAQPIYTDRWNLWRAVGVVGIVGIAGVYLIAKNPGFFTTVIQPEPRAIKPEPRENPREPREKPPDVEPHPVAIASFDPIPETLTIAEDGSQQFRITLANSDNSTVPTWSLDGQTVAQAPSWVYRPDFHAGRLEPHELRVVVGDGASSDQHHRWQITVTDVNQLPKIEKVNPSPNSVVTADAGSKVRFETKASDADGDSLQYAWTLDGKAVGENRPVFDWKGTGEHRVGVTVSDGKGAAPPMEWTVASIAPFQFDPRPPTADITIRFNDSKKFEILPRPDTPTADVSYAWTVDKRPVDGSRFLNLTADQLQWVHVNPILIEVKATTITAPDRRYSYAWRATIVPPLPSIVDSNPPFGTVRVRPGKSKVFELTPSKPLGGQTYKYIYRVDGIGTEVQRDSPSYEFVPGDRKSYDLVASVIDNFQQKSKERAWKVLIEDDIIELTRAWLKDLRLAFEKQDVKTLTTMQHLGPNQQEQLAAAFKTQRKLQVTFEDMDIQPVGDGKARARYRRVDSFVDPNGTPRTFTTPIEQTFVLNDGRVSLEH